MGLVGASGRIPVLAELVDARMGRLSGPVRDVVDVLALGGPLGVTVPGRLTDPAAVEQAEERGLVSVERDLRRLHARLAHPLYGEVRRTAMGELRGRRLRGRLAVAPADTGAVEADETLRRAVLVLDSDLQPDPALLGSLNDGRLAEDVWLDTALTQVMHVAVMTARNAEQEPDRFIQVTPSAHQMRLVWMRCQACRCGFVDDDHLDGPAPIAWATWVIPRRLTTDDATGVVSSVVGPDSDETRRPYRLHLARLADDLGLVVQDLGWDQNTPCPNCGEQQWTFLSAAAF